GVVLRHRRAGVLADVETLVEREAQRGRPFDAPLGDLLAVHAEHGRGPLPQAAAVVLEVEPDGVFAGRHLVLGGDLVVVLFLVRVGVVEARLAVHDHQAPAAETAADRGEYAGRSVFRHLHVGRDGKRAIARGRSASLGDARHAWVVCELGPTLGQAWSCGRI